MRRALALALVLGALSACQAQAPAPSNEPRPQDGLVGAWRAHIKAGSGALAAMPDLEFMTVFNAGGTMTESSNYDGAPPCRRPMACGAGPASAPSRPATTSG